ncbi:MAG: hypothetical protein KTR14_05040 [Vampirovibrio sp.]|nr:hypothetical protein [Vampirovibrio sp.]
MAGMTELEMAMKLGLLNEPEQNRVYVDHQLMMDLQYLKHVFKAVSKQSEDMGRFNPDVWCELVPWHSLN